MTGAAAQPRGGGLRFMFTFFLCRHKFGPRHRLHIPSSRGRIPDRDMTATVDRHLGEGYSHHRLATLLHHTLGPLRTRPPRYDGGDCSSKGARGVTNSLRAKRVAITNKCKHTGLHELIYQRPRHTKASDPARRAPQQKRKRAHSVR